MESRVGDSLQSLDVGLERVIVVGILPIIQTQVTCCEGEVMWSSHFRKTFKIWEMTVVGLWRVARKWRH